jgi:hypothetical protein
LPQLARSRRSVNYHSLLFIPQQLQQVNNLS